MIILKIMKRYMITQNNIIIAPLHNNNKLTDLITIQ